MNPDLFKIVQVSWNSGDNTVKEITVEHIDSGVKSILQNPVYLTTEGSSKSGVAPTIPRGGLIEPIRYNSTTYGHEVTLDKINELVVAVNKLILSK
jgi:hypothetical protein